MQMMKPLSSKEKELVRNFAYRGGDSSYIYAFALSPLAQTCVDWFIPMWLAPNIITLLGLFATAGSLALTIIFNPTLGPNGPSWLHLVSGFSILFYQTLDNMDGKQARRTGSSSALGMLFDHGCDSLNASICAPVISSVLGLGWTTPGIFFGLLCGFIPFYIATWESYYTDRMDIPVFNGPTEGLLIAASMCFVSFYIGPSWWHEPNVQIPTSYLMGYDASYLGSFFPHIQSVVGMYSFTYYNLITLSAILVTLITIGSQFIGVALIVIDNDSRLRGDDDSRLRGDVRKQSIVNAASNLLPLFLLFPCALYYCSTSTVAFSMYPITTMLLLGTSFVEMTVHIMVAQICSRFIEPFQRWTAFAMVFLVVQPILQQHHVVTSTVEIVILVTLSLLSFVFTTVQIVLTCNEFCAALDIYIFKLGQRSLGYHKIK